MAGGAGAEEVGMDVPTAAVFLPWQEGPHHIPSQEEGNWGWGGSPVCPPTSAVLFLAALLTSGLSRIAHLWEWPSSPQAAILG